MWLWQPLLLSFLLLLMFELFLDDIGILMQYKINRCSIVQAFCIGPLKIGGENVVIRLESGAQSLI